MDQTARPDRPRGYAKGAVRRDAIVAAATEVFGTLGYRSATMLQIAVACGISRAGLLHHFPTKESLLEAVLSHRDATDCARLHPPAGRADEGRAEEGRAEEGLAEEGLGALADLVRLAAHNSTVPLIVNLFAVLSAEAGDPDHPAHAYFVHRYDLARDQLARALVRVQEQGLLRPGVEPYPFATELLALMDGLQVQWLLAPERIAMAELLRHRIETALTVRLPGV